MAKHGGIGRRAVVALTGALALLGGAAGPAAGQAPLQEPDIISVAAPVVGGTLTPGGLPRIPVVALVVPGASDADGTFCTGTVIAAAWVLTAAHCVNDPFEVRYGTTDLAQPGQRRTVVADGILTVAALDLALVRIDRPFDGVTPARFAVPGLQVVHGHGAVVEVWGWGQSESTPGGPADQYDGRLRMAAVTVRPTALCAQIYGTALTTQLCAGNGQTGQPLIGACPGDSGGPVVARAARPGGGVDEVVVGVVSFGGATCGDTPFVSAPVADVGISTETVTGRSVAPYPDVSGNPLRPGIEAVTAAGVVGGYPDGTFGPQRSVTRGQMATFVTRALDIGNPPPRSFPDIAGSPHEVAITRLAGAGVVTGFADGTFRPNVDLSRAQLATYLARSAGLPVVAPNPSIPDVATNDVHAATIAAVVAAGILDLRADGRFDPGSRPTRADMSDAIARLLVRAAFARGPWRTAAQSGPARRPRSASREVGRRGRRGPAVWRCGGSAPWCSTTLRTMRAWLVSRGSENDRAHPSVPGTQLGEGLRPLEEDADRHRLDVDGAEGGQVRHDRVEDRTLVGRARREVLVERHRRRAFVRLPRPPEPSSAPGTGPRRHDGNHRSRMVWRRDRQPRGSTTATE
jgi:hypothetical protein